METRDVDEAASPGYQPNSFRIGDMWYQMNRLGPLGMHLSLAADLYDVVADADIAGMAGRVEAEDSGDPRRCGRGEMSGARFPIPKPWAPAGLTAIYMQRIRRDPVAPAKVEPKIRNIELTDQEYAGSPELPAGSPRCSWTRS
jgi:hypothetical protein